MKFENKLFLQLDSQYKALFLCQKFIESIMYLCLLSGKYVYKNFQTLCSCDVQQCYVTNCKSSHSIYLVQLEL